MKNKSKRVLLLILGVALIAIGLGLFFAGFAGLTQSLACPINGCPSIFSSNYAIDWAEVIVGFVFIVSGISMIIVSRRMKVVGDARDTGNA